MKRGRDSSTLPITCEYRITTRSFHDDCGGLTLPITSTVLNLALNHASSPNCPLRIRPRVKSFGKPHTAEMNDASRRLFTLGSAHAV